MKETIKEMAIHCQRVRDTAYRLKKRIELDQDPKDLKCTILINSLEENLKKATEQFNKFKDGLS